ncbi:MAG: redox-sensing transcriptional repressor Rex [Phycisphaerae bacterium]
MNHQSVPEPVVRRLCLYLRELEALSERGVAKVSSRQMAHDLHVTDAQVRKDLAYFGQFGRPGLGYRVQPLRDELRRILGTDQPLNVIVVGAGDLGRALLRYRGFRRKGFHLVAAFDVAKSKVGTKIGPVPVYHMDRMPEVVRRQDVKLAVVAVPAGAAQEVADALCEAGVGGILNFAPTTLETPEGVAVRLVDLAAHLEQLSFEVGRAQI